MVSSSTSTVVTSVLQQVSSIAPAHERPQSPVKQGGWASPDSLLTKLFSGNITAIAIAFAVTVTLPILLHFIFYTQSARSRASGGSGDGIPSFLFLGPSGAGKTSLVTLLQRRVVELTGRLADNADAADVDEKPAVVVNGDGNGHIIPSATRLSQVTSTIGMRLPPGTPLGSNKYRSEHDFEVAASKKEGPKYKIIDTPGHGKLRLEHALSYIQRPGLGLRGIVFVLDSSAMDTSSADGGEVAKDTIAYLHDVLLSLQRRPKLVKKSKPEDVQVLVACNKQDLFTSLPPSAVRSRFETELERVKASKKKGISAVDAKEDMDVNEDDTVLGGGGEERFSFKLFEEEFGIVVDVIGGAVKGDDEGKQVSKWEEWIGGCL